MNPISWDIGDGVTVRTFTPADAEALFALVEANRERLHRWMAWEPSTRGPADTLAFIERSLASDRSLDANGIYVQGELAGGAGIDVDMLTNSAEIGYWIDAKHEGKGIVTRVCSRFFDFAFDELGLHRVELHAAVGNARSRAVAERLGMVLEGVARDGLRVPDGYMDEAIYGILEDEWRSRRS